MKKARANPDPENDFQRLRVQDQNWRLNDVNVSYKLCGSYPQYIVVPGTLSDGELVAAAGQRSAGRLPALSYLHPLTGAPLCRASQPKAGMSGGFLEHDKKLLLAIKNSCPSGLPLRIADARPKLNANANAVQGKGFENVTFLGGPSCAALVFMDIENIHVMRSSIGKLRECLNFSSLSSRDTPATSGVASAISSTFTDAMGAAAGPSDVDVAVSASRWLHHVAGVLRGATGVADSLCMGHPVLVHCSDGWDRTAQLTSLAMLLVDPFYRTVEGFYLLVQKEWCSFGHKFEDRLGETTHKESSPIFLQFLDCVHQLVRQYPTHFEYSEYFLTFFAQCTYSGYFSTFRGNNEMERYFLMRSLGPYEEMPPDEFDFSTVFCYINLLLYRGNASDVLLNSLYVPPSSANKQCAYLRPRCSTSEMVVWLEGLGGLNPWLLFNSGMGLVSPRYFEQLAVIDNVNTR